MILIMLSFFLKTLYISNLFKVSLSLAIAPSQDYVMTILSICVRKKLSLKKAGELLKGYQKVKYLEIAFPTSGKI